MATIDIFEFRSLLKINKFNLDGELETHAQCFERIGREVAMLAAVVAQNKNNLDYVESECIRQIKEFDPKTTNPQADKQAKTKPKYKQAWSDYMSAKLEHDEWTALLNAWSARGYNLKTLADLHGQDYFAITTVTGDKRQNTEDTSLQLLIRQASNRVQDQRTSKPIARRRTST